MFCCIQVRFERSNNTPGNTGRYSVSILFDIEKGRARKGVGVGGGGWWEGGGCIALARDVIKDLFKLFRPAS